MTEALAAEPADRPAATRVLVVVTGQRHPRVWMAAIRVDGADRGLVGEIGRLCADLLRAEPPDAVPAAPRPQVCDPGSPPAGPTAGPLPVPLPGPLSAGIERAIGYLRENFADADLSLDAAARVACLSRWHFSRTFRAQTGRRFVEYLAGLRLERAAALLATTDRSVAEISRRVGYRELRHFQRSFKRWSGESPSRHRQRRRATAGGGGS